MPVRVTEPAMERLAPRILHTLSLRFPDEPDRVSEILSDRERVQVTVDDRTAPVLVNIIVRVDADTFEVFTPFDPAEERLEVLGDELVPRLSS